MYIHYQTVLKFEIIKYGGFLFKILSFYCQNKLYTMWNCKFYSTRSIYKVVVVTYVYFIMYFI